MESSKLTNHLTETRQRPYYSKYIHRVSFQVPHTNRHLRHSSYSTGQLMEITGFDASSLPRDVATEVGNWRYHSRLLYNSEGALGQSIISQQAQNSLETVLDWAHWLVAHPSGQYDYKMMHSSGIITLYTNDLALIDSLKIAVHATFHTASVNVVGDVGIIRLKNPQHKYRTYLRTRRLKPAARTELVEFIQRYPQSIHPCGALSRWISDEHKHWWQREYLQSNLFFEHDSESESLMFTLVFPDLIRKTFKIEQQI